MSVAKLRQLFEATAGDPDLHQWLKDGLRRWREGEELENALGLESSAIANERNAALVRAASLLPANLTAYQKAEHLARRLRLPPRDNGLLDDALKAVRKSAKYSRSLVSARRIYDLLSAEQNKTAGNLLDLLPPPLVTDKSTEMVSP